MDSVAPGWDSGRRRTWGPIRHDLCRGSVFVRYVLGFSGFFNLHVTELFGVKDLATLQALDKLGVFVPGNDTYPGVLADGCHRFWFVWMKYSFRKIVAVFSII